MASPTVNQHVSPISMDAMVPTPTGHTDLSLPASMVFYFSLGLCVTATVVCSLWTQSTRYYQTFRKSDQRWALWGIGFGCFGATGGLIADTVQLSLLINHVYTDYPSIIATDQRMNMAKQLLASLFRLQASCFFVWRVYRLAGCKRWVLGLYAIPTIGSFAFALYVNIKGMVIPAIEQANLPVVQAFFLEMQYLSKVSGWLNAAHDTVLCATILVLLYNSKTSLFNMEKGLLKKLTSISFQSMLPPVVCIMVVEIGSLFIKQPTQRKDGVARTQVDGLFLLFWAPLGPLYIHSLLITLNSRKRLRELLNANLASQGIERLTTSGSGSGFGAHTHKAMRGGNGHGGNRYGENSQLSLSGGVNITIDKVSAVHSAPSYPQNKSLNRSPVPGAERELDQEEDIDTEMWQLSQVSHLQVEEAQAAAAGRRKSIRFTGTRPQSSASAVVAMGRYGQEWDNDLEKQLTLESTRTERSGDGSIHPGSQHNSDDALNTTPTLRYD